MGRFVGFLALRKMLGMFHIYIYLLCNHFAKTSSLGLHRTVRRRRIDIHIPTLEEAMNRAPEIRGRLKAMQTATCPEDETEQPTKNVKTNAFSTRSYFSVRGPNPFTPMASEMVAKRAREEPKPTPPPEPPQPKEPPAAPVTPDGFRPPEAVQPKKRPEPLRYPGAPRFTPMEY